MSDSERERSVDADGQESTDAGSEASVDADEEVPSADGADVDGTDSDEAADGEAVTGSETAASEADEADSDEPESEIDEPESEIDEAAIADRVADSDPEEVAAEIADLRERTDELESEVEDLESRLKRKQAEFQNYKKRQEKRREQERERATEDLVERLLEVRDNLRRAIEQDADADIREGVEATFRLLDDVLEAENVEPIEPEAGTEVDPQRHEVLLRVESDQPEGTVADVHRPGYEMAGKVLRAAQVTVAEDGE